MSEAAAMLHGSGETNAEDEAGLVQAAQADPAAFIPLYHRYLDRIYAYLRARTASDDEAADLTQQVFLQALDALARYRGVRDGSFAAWLFRIARNAAIDAHRRRRVAVAWDLLPEALQPLAAHDPDARLLRREEVARLRVLFGQLDAETRELLALRFAGGLTIAEIAAVVGKSKAATQKRLFRTLQALKERYHDETL